MFKKFIVYALIGLIPLAANATGGEFYQLDEGVGGGSAVFAKEVGSWQLTGAYSQWSSTGKSLSGSAVRNVFARNEGDTTVKFSVGLGAISHHSDPSAASPSASSVGLKLNAESFTKFDKSSVYTLAEYNTAFRTWLGVVQVKPLNSQVGVEWSAVGDDRWYVGHKVAMTWRLRNSPWSLRVGHQLNDGANFIGVSYNTF